MIDYALMVIYATKIFNLNFLPTLYELTYYLMWSYKNIPILILLAQWHIICFTWRKWYMVKMRLSTT